MRYASYQLDGTTWCGVVGPDGLHPLPAGLTGLDLVRSGLPAALDAGAAALRGPDVLLERDEVPYGRRPQRRQQPHPGQRHGGPAQGSGTRVQCGGQSGPD